MTRRQRVTHGFVIFAIALAYYASNPQFLFAQLVKDQATIEQRLGVSDNTPYAWLTASDYSFRLAEALLNGELGLTDKPPSWLNEMIPLHGKYYAVFPLGSILTMAPFVLLERITGLPAPAILVPAIATAAALLFFLIARGYGLGFNRCLVLMLFVMFGTWLWTNLVMAGAWQLTLGFALVGELGAIYFILTRRHPLFAGLLFALAIGNRTEIVVVTPIVVFLLLRGSPAGWQSRLIELAKFGAVPVFLGVATLVHNAARFGSPFDFGLARIPGVLNEPWYQFGIFSARAIPGNLWQMLVEPWHRADRPPFLLPGGFGGSIFLDAPFLICIFGIRPRHRDRAIASWAAIALLTVVYWCHGNTGGWQFSYRCAIGLLPWFFLLILEHRGDGTPKWQTALLILSITINGYATYLFLWTNWIEP